MMKVCLVLLAVGAALAAPPKQGGQWALDDDGYHYHYNPPASGPGSYDFTNKNEDRFYDWRLMGQKELEKAQKIADSTIRKPAKNVIIFVGDGMGVSTVTAARILNAQNKDLVGEEMNLSFENMPHVGLSKTYATDQTVADSANTATAILTGVKTSDSILGANARAIFNNCTSLHGNEEQSILEYSIDKGKWTGVVTSTRLTHATPAASYSKSASRDFESDYDLERYCIKSTNCETCTDIAKQLVYGNSIGDWSRQIRVILGGGRQKFMTVNETDPEYPNVTGVRKDENLFEAWQNQKHEMGYEKDSVHVVFNKTQFEEVDETKAEYLMGLFEPGHVHYAVDRDDRTMNPWEEPSLVEMTEKAINMLSRNEQGFFLLVEGGRIDHAHHDTNAHRSLTETIEFHEAIQKAMDMTDEEDTMITVTADHSHVFTIAGYGSNVAPILGYDDSIKPMDAPDGKPYMTLGYTNGPGFYNHRTANGSINTEQPRLNLSTLDMETILGKDFLQDAGIPRHSETHGGEEVPIYARGPMAHLFHGVHEQSYIGNLAMYASCVGPNQDLCNSQPAPTTTNPNGASRVHVSAAVLTAVLALIHLLL